MCFKRVQAATAALTLGAHPFQSRIVAHRGYPKYYPENTLCSLQAALANKAAALEFDIQCSKDGTPYLYHDASLRRISGVDALIYQQSDAQLTALSAHYPQRFGAKYKNEPICSLADASQFLADYPQITVFIEPKIESLQQIGRRQMLDAILQASRLIKKRYIISFDSHSIDYVARLGEKTAWVLDQLNGAKLTAAKKLNADLLCCNIDKINSDNEHLLNKAEFMLYCCDDAAAIYRLLSAGYAYIETDAIGEVLRQKLIAR